MEQRISFASPTTMIKVYLDWNIISGLKNGLFPELKTILENKEKFLLVYSTAHIGDIMASVRENDSEQDQRIAEDLEFISQLTENRCMAIHNKEIYIDRSIPKEVFDEQRRSNLIFEDFSLDELIRFSTEVVEDEAIKSIIVSVFERLRSLPLDPIFVSALADENSDLNKMFPGLRDNPTMEGFFKSFGAMYRNLNDTTAYKDLREMVQKIGVNGGHFNPGASPFEILENAYAQMGIQPRQFLEPGKHAPVWYDQITNEYLLLDMHGYKADKVKITPRHKSTFHNTAEDAFHAAFASRFEIYITNDDRNYHKTKAVYQKLEIGTLVIKPDEFLMYYNNYLDYHTVEEHYNSVKARIINTEGWEQHNFEDGSPFLTRFCGEIFFNFFNKITLPRNGASPYFLLTKLHRTEDAYYVSYDEINGVIRLLTSSLGTDVESKGEVTGGDIDIDWSGRTWKTNIGDIVFRRNNTWFQLYFYLNSPTPKNETSTEVRSWQHRIKRWLKRIFNKNHYMFGDLIRDRLSQL